MEAEKSCCKYGWLDRQVNPTIAAQHIAATNYSKSIYNIVGFQGRIEHPRAPDIFGIDVWNLG